MERLSRWTILYYFFKHGKNIFFAYLALNVLSASQIIKIIALVTVISSIVAFFLDSLETLFFYKWRLTEETIYIRSGIFDKKELTVNLEDIRSIRISQPFMLKVFNVFEVEIEINSSVVRNLKLKFIKKTQKANFEKVKKVNEANNEYLSFKNKTVYEYKLTKNRILKSSIFTMNYLYVLVVFYFFQDLLDNFQINLDIWEAVKLFYNEQKWIFITFTVVIVIFVTIIKQYFNYSKFEMKFDGDNIIINNGIVAKDSLSLECSQIVGIRIRQTVGQRINGLWSLEVIVQNHDKYSEHTKIKDVLPYATKEEIANFLKNLDIKFIEPKYLFKNEWHIFGYLYQGSDYLSVKKGNIYWSTIYIEKSAVLWERFWKIGNKSFSSLSLLAEHRKHYHFLKKGEQHE
jgi:uncharacterized membrane protein YdbT with pleckstrin-like domain